MTLTTTLKQLLDDDGHAPLEITWEIEYVPSANKTFVIHRKSVTAMWLWIGKTAHRVEKWRHEWVGDDLIKLDAYRDAEIAYAHLLDEEALMAKCQEHWDTDGATQWREPWRAA